MLTEDLAYGDINLDYSQLGQLVSFNYENPQQQKHLENYQQLVNFHDGHNTDRLIELLERDQML